ncbi:hypothetical protein Nepgr_015042 [Nepenthes gracilis]|uniref:Uncharacterized protein n=1 Tax=Nepenthes gracilis TaxID=150966 RepID=A0AAD3XQY7_NEPGR|nr:hypothetical protein Nepgr_015042 [Nepenthes gracilis]
MQMLEDEMDISIVDLQKVVSFLPTAMGPNQPCEYGPLSIFNVEDSMPVVGCPSSSFPSVVDELFEPEKGTFASHSVPNISSSFSTSSASHFGSISASPQSIKLGCPLQIGMGTLRCHL